MNRGVIIKSVREVRWAIGLFAVAVFAIQWLLGYVMPMFSRQLSVVLLELPFVRNMVKGLVGIDIGSGMTVNVMQAFAWVHPIMLATLWAQEISFCTRLPAGEVDRGTIDVLLSLPVSRARLYVSETLVWLVGGAILCIAGLLGNLLGTALSDTAPVSFLGRVVVLSNLYCLYLAVGGLVLLVSSLSNRRGRAVAVVVGILLTSFLLNFLAQLWEPANRLAFLGVLHYYRPVAAIDGTVWPVSDMVVLVTLGGVFWLLGLVVFERRDICTV